MALALYVNTSFAQNNMMAEREGSITKRANDSWTCKMCDKEYMDKKSLKCEYCDKTFCSKCLNLTNAEYKLFDKRSDLHWYCPSCEEENHDKYQNRKRNRR